LASASGALQWRGWHGGFGEQCEDGAGSMGNFGSLLLEAGSQLGECFGFGGADEEAVVSDFDEVGGRDVQLNQIERTTPVLQSLIAHMQVACGGVQVGMPDYWYFFM
jgi:hypothetical protein